MIARELFISSTQSPIECTRACLVTLAIITTGMLESKGIKGCKITNFYMNKNKDIGKIELYLDFYLRIWCIFFHEFCDSNKIAYSARIFVGTKVEINSSCKLIQVRCRVASMTAIAILRWNY